MKETLKTCEDIEEMKKIESVPEVREVVREI